MLHLFACLTGQTTFFCCSLQCVDAAAWTKLTLPGSPCCHCATVDIGLVHYSTHMSLTLARLCGEWRLVSGNYKARVLGFILAVTVRNGVLAVTAGNGILAVMGCNGILAVTGRNGILAVMA